MLIDVVRENMQVAVLQKNDQEDKRKYQQMILCGAC